MPFLFFWARAHLICLHLLLVGSDCTAVVMIFTPPAVAELICACAVLSHVISYLWHHVLDDVITYNLCNTNDGN